MIFDYHSLLPQDFDNNSKVWIYQSNRHLQINEALVIEELLNTFVKNWKSHGASVKGYANLFFGQFIVLIADETKNTVGGCSTDSSVRIIKDIGNQFQVDFFNRQYLAFKVKNKLEIVPFNQVLYALKTGLINSNTIYFDNLVSNLADFKEKWMIPVKDSWLASKINDNYFE